MAIIVQALVLCATDDPVEAENSTFAALNGGVFDSANSILDFVTGIEQKISLSPDYEDGTFAQMVPAATYLLSASAVANPC